MTITVLLMVGCLEALAAPPKQPVTPATTQASPRKTTALIQLHGAIDNFARDQMFKRFATARSAGADTILLEIDTPGGHVMAAMQMSRFLKQQDDLHITAVIKEKALSAGALIALACNEIVMEPNALLGDCAPIAITESGQLQTLGETERAKMESPILTDFYESSIRNGYDPLLTQSMVAMKRVVHWVEDKSGTRRFVDADEYRKLTAAGWKPVPGVPDPLDREDTLLTVHSQLAEKIGLAKQIVPNAAALAAERNWNVVARLEATTGEKIIQLMNHPALRGLLIFIFMQSLWIALSHPGHGMPEVFAVVAIGLLVGIPMLTGHASWWEVAMIVVALVLLAVELFVVPGFGLTGISGIVLMLVGLIFTFSGGEPSLPGWLPSLSGTWDALERGLFFVTIGLAATMALSFWLRKYLPRMPYFNRLILSDVSGVTIPIDVESKEGQWPGIGVQGQAMTDLKPSGSAQFVDLATNEQVVVSVISESGYVSRGATVTVTEVSGNRVVVKEAV